MTDQIHTLLFPFKYQKQKYSFTLSTKNVNKGRESLSHGNYLQAESVHGKNDDTSMTVDFT